MTMRSKRRQKNPPESYTCAACGGTFAKGWSDEEARAESRDVCGVDPATDPTLAVVCDVCYRAILASAELRALRDRATPSRAYGVWLRSPGREWLGD